MKKTLLFISSAVLALTVSAGSYVPTEKGDIKAGSTITSVDGVVLTFGGEKDAEFSLEGIGDKDFGVYALDYNGVSYAGYFNGANNPKIDNSGTPSPEAGMPNTGTYFKFDVSKNGSIDVCYVLNASKAFFVYEVDGTTIAALADFNGITTAEKVYQGSTFNVQAGRTYYVFCTGSKLGFFGFNFTEATGVKTLNSSNATVVKTDYYSITGQKCSVPVKGINIVRKTMSNGKIETSKIIILQ